jgi:hypothetical protein
MKRRLYHWPSVQAYFEAGHGFVACQRRFGFSHAAWIKAIGRGDLRVPKPEAPFADRRRRYDWATIQAYYDSGHSHYQCRAKFGFSEGGWHKAIQRQEIRSRGWGRTIAELLQTSRNRWHVKKRLIEAGILENRCAWCGLTEWRGQPLAIELDHINGQRNDHRIENLRMLCPNCHSQTDTHGARNRKIRRQSRVV